MTYVAKQRFFCIFHIDTQHRLVTSIDAPQPDLLRFATRMVLSAKELFAIERMAIAGMGHKKCCSCQDAHRWRHCRRTKVRSVAARQRKPSALLACSPPDASIRKRFHSFVLTANQQHNQARLCPLHRVTVHVHLRLLWRA